MQRLLRCLMLATLLVLAPAARATFHIIAIDEIYSNADGTIQYMELLASADSQDQLAGHTILTMGPGGQHDLHVSDQSSQRRDLRQAHPGRDAGIRRPQPRHARLHRSERILPDRQWHGHLRGGRQSVEYTTLPTDGVNALMANGMPGPNVATNFAGVSASVMPAAPPVLNYQGLWWKPDESGWGVNFAHQGDQVFATWYTYDTAGNAYWLSMLAPRTTADQQCVPRRHLRRRRAAVQQLRRQRHAHQGRRRHDHLHRCQQRLRSPTTSTWARAARSSVVRRRRRSPGSSSTAGRAARRAPTPRAPNLAAATNYQDLWWVPTESGWGINFAHQGDSCSPPGTPMTRRSRATTRRCGSPR